MHYQRKPKLLDEDREFALYLAKWVRYGLEDMHAEVQLTPEARRLNTAIRDSIYTALRMLRSARSGDSDADEIVLLARSGVESYWEEPTLLSSYRDVLATSRRMPQTDPTRTD